ncbi:MAG TPA: AEC family transporter, partial [Petrotogaceae bacterium]|nr:AEC family transporter [Petrotogaceae bacterium]
YPIDMLNDAAITFILIYIGVTLSRVKLSPSNVKQTVLLTALKLLFLPILGFLAVSIVPMEPMYRKIFLLETAMPTAMNMVVVTAELNKEPEVGSLVVFFTTAFSVLTIPFWSIFI